MISELVCDAKAYDKIQNSNGVQAKIFKVHTQMHRNILLKNAIPICRPKEIAASGTSAI